MEVWEWLEQDTEYQLRLLQDEDDEDSRKLFEAFLTLGLTASKSELDEVFRSTLLFLLNHRDWRKVIRLQLNLIDYVCNVQPCPLSKTVAFCLTQLLHEPRTRAVFRKALKNVYLC